MASKVVLEVYEEYERSRGDLVGLPSILADTFPIDQVLYPGSYVDLSPSFIFPNVVYVDTDRRAEKFFADRSGVEDLVNARKRYENLPRSPSITPTTPT